MSNSTISRSSRVTLLAALLLLAASVTAAAAQTRGRSGLPAGPGNPFAALSGASRSGAALYDSAGVKIGDVLGVVDHIVPVVLVNAGDRQVSLRASAQHLYGVRVQFESEDCTGAPLLTMPFFDSPNAVAPVLSVAGVVGPTVYAADPEAPVRAVRVKSRLTVDGLCIGSSFGSMLSVVDGVPVLDLSTLVPPFAVR